MRLKNLTCRIVVRDPTVRRRWENEKHPDVICHLKRSGRFLWEQFSTFFGCHSMYERKMSRSIISIWEGRGWNCLSFQEALQVKGRVSKGLDGACGSSMNGNDKHPYCTVAYCTVSAPLHFLSRLLRDLQMKGTWVLNASSFPSKKKSIFIHTMYLNLHPYHVSKSTESTNESSNHIIR